MAKKPGGKPFEFKVFPLIFAFLLLAVLSSSVWHAMPRMQYPSLGVSLTEYDTIAYEGERSCFSLEYKPPVYDINKVETAMVLSEGKILAYETITFRDVEDPVYVKTVCFDADEAADTNEPIKVKTYFSTLFFHLEKKAGERPQAAEPEVKLAGLDEGSVSFSVRNYPVDRYAPVEIFVNNELDHRVYPKRADSEFSERISLEPGQNSVEIRFGNASAGAVIEVERDFKMPFAFGILLLVLSLFVFTCFVFPEYGLVKALALGTAATASVFMLLVFALGMLGILNAVAYITLFIVMLLSVAVLRRKHFSLSKPQSIRRIDLLVLLVIALFAVISLGFHVQSYSHMTYWNGFYERMSLMVREQNAIPELDPLSYFGRGYSFVPGYFFFNTGIAWLTGLEGIGLYALIMAFSNTLFFLSAFYLGKSLKLSSKQRALFILLVISEGFLLTSVTLSPRHGLAFALFMLSLALYFDRKSLLLSGIVLGMAAFIQAPLLAFFPVFAFIASRKFEARRAVVPLLVGCAVFFLLFMPSLLRYGLPYQVESGSWGYLIRLPFEYLYQDFAVLFGFFLLFYLVDLLKGRIKFTPYTKKLFVMAVLGLLIQTFISYRYNVITALNLGLLLTLWFPYKKLKDVHFSRLLILLAAGVVISLLAYVNSAEEAAIDPMEYLKENTSSDARILADPLFGHAIAYFSDRATLADLMVEYAKPEMLDDAYTFLLESDYSVLEKHSIDYTFNHSNYINLKAMSGKYQRDPIEFGKLDKIYANGFIFIHRNRAEWEGS